MRLQTSHWPPPPASPGSQAQAARILAGLPLLRPQSSEIPHFQGRFGALLLCEPLLNRAPFPNAACSWLQGEPTLPRRSVAVSSSAGPEWLGDLPDVTSPPRVMSVG